MTCAAIAGSASEHQPADAVALEVHALPGAAAPVPVCQIPAFFLPGRRRQAPRFCPQGCTTPGVPIRKFSPGRLFFIYPILLSDSGDCQGKRRKHRDSSVS